MDTENLPMRALLMNKVVNYSAVSLLVTSLFISTTASAMSYQGGLSTTVKSEKESVLVAKAEANESKKAPVLARNTAAKPAPATTAATAPKDHDKKTVSRCWQRLMTMVREVSHAHRTSNN